MATRIIPEYSKSTQPPKIITCTDGTECLVDAEDYALLVRHNWYTNYSGQKAYVITKLKTDQSKIWRCLFIHHVILGTSSQIDHKDGNPLNNQKHNLRSATTQENGWNTRKRMTIKGGKQPSSLYKGVSKYISTSGETLFRVQIKLTRKGEVPAKFFRKHGFKDEISAALAYNDEVKKLRGEFAFLNVITKSKGGQS